MLPSLFPLLATSCNFCVDLGMLYPYHHLRKNSIPVPHRLLPVKFQDLLSHSGAYPSQLGTSKNMSKWRSKWAWLLKSDTGHPQQVTSKNPPQFCARLCWAYIRVELLPLPSPLSHRHWSLKMAWTQNSVSASPF